MDDKLKWGTALVVPYGILCGVLYQYGYWGEFGVDPSHYLSIQGFFVRSLYSLIYVVGITLIFSLFGVGLKWYMEHLEKKDQEDLIRANKPLPKKYLGNDKANLMLGGGILILYILSTVIDGENIFLKLGRNFALLAVFLLFYAFLWLGIYKLDPKMRLICFFTAALLAWIPFYSFDSGENAANSIMRQEWDTGNKVCYVSRVDDPMKLEGWWLGKMGEHSFFLGKAKDIVHIVHESQIREIEIRKIPVKDQAINRILRWRLQREMSKAKNEVTPARGDSSIVPQPGGSPNEPAKKPVDEQLESKLE